MGFCGVLRTGRSAVTLISLLMLLGALGALALLKFAADHPPDNFTAEDTRGYDALVLPILAVAALGMFGLTASEKINNTVRFWC
jgi:hypothetical protein